jgi:hypothetical protein
VILCEALSSIIAECNDFERGYNFVVGWLVGCILQVNRVGRDKKQESDTHRWVKASEKSSRRKVSEMPGTSRWEHGIYVRSF